MIIHYFLRLLFVDATYLISDLHYHCHDISINTISGNYNLHVYILIQLSGFQNVFMTFCGYTSIGHKSAKTRNRFISPLPLSHITK